MKAITLTQPWATAVILGLKPWETRSWRTTYRGPLAIHAGVTMPRYAREFAGEQALRGVIPVHLPRGSVLGIVQLVACVPARDAEPDEWGDYSPGRFAWKFEDIDAFEEPIPAKGALGLWEWER